MPSASTVFVDTNVLLYSQDPREPGKCAAAQAWLVRCWSDGLGRTSSQVLNEMYANLRRVAPKLSVDEARTLVRRYRAWTPWLVDEGTVDLAWDLQDRCALGFWDATVVAAAQLQGCEVLLTEDLQHGQRIDKLRVLNPFVIGPEALDTPNTA